MAREKLRSILKQLISKYLKTICVIALFVPVIPRMINTHYEDVTTHTVSSTCSPRYPAYSKILDMAVTLPDGALQVGGWVYPQHTLWRESGIVRGCPCLVGPCIRSCFPNIQNLYIHKTNGTFAMFNFPQIREKSEQTRTLQVSSASDPFKMINVSRRHFSTLEVDCKGGFQVASHAYLMENGKVWRFDVLYDAANYGICFNLMDDELLWNNVFGCTVITDYNFGKLESSKLIISIKVQVVVAVLLLVTFVLQILVPSLRHPHFGLTFMGYTFALLFYRIVGISHMLSEFYHEIRKYTYLLSRPMPAVTMMWQTVVVLQMWTVFKPGSLTPSIKYEETPKFIWYSSMIWAYYVLDDIMLWKWEKQGKKITLYFETVIMLTTLILHISTLLRLRKSITESKKTQGPYSQRHNAKEYQWTSVFLKFSLLTSLDFTVVNLLMHLYFIADIPKTDSSSPLRYIFSFQSYLLSLRGVEIFFMYVWQEKTWTAFKTKFISK